MISLGAVRTIVETKHKTKLQIPWKAMQSPVCSLGRQEQCNWAKQGTSIFESVQQPFHCWAAWLVKISIFLAIALLNGIRPKKWKTKPKPKPSSNLECKFMMETFYVNGATNAWFEREKQMPKTNLVNFIIRIHRMSSTAAQRQSVRCWFVRVRWVQLQNSHKILSGAHQAPRTYTHTAIGAIKMDAILDTIRNNISQRESNE